MFLWVFTSSAHSFTGFECAKIRMEFGRAIANGENLVGKSSGIVPE